MRSPVHGVPPSLFPFFPFSRSTPSSWDGRHRDHGHPFFDSNLFSLGTQSAAKAFRRLFFPPFPPKPPPPRRKVPPAPSSPVFSSSGTDVKFPSTLFLLPSHLVSRGAMPFPVRVFFSLQPANSPTTESCPPQWGSDLIRDPSCEG